jgi:hypothetical protein
MRDTCLFRGFSPRRSFLLDFIHPAVTGSWHFSLYRLLLLSLSSALYSSPPLFGLLLFDGGSKKKMSFFQHFRREAMVGYISFRFIVS